MFAQAAQQDRVIPGAVATLGVDARKDFLKKTYGHLLGAILAFVAIEWLFIGERSPLGDAVTGPMFKLLGTSQWSWLIVLGLFMVVGKVAQGFALNDSNSRGLQYLGLGLYVLAEALIFVPLLFIAANYYPGVISVAGIATILLFVGLTATVVLTKKDFSFLGGILGVASMAGLGLIVCSVLFGFSIGLVGTVAFIALAAGYVLYYTSFVLAHCRPTQHVGGALLLFSAIALLFWYVLQLFMRLRD
jgi:hypothetical protein